MLDQAHRKRNIAEYEGAFDVEGKLVEALIRVTEGGRSARLCLTMGCSFGSHTSLFQLVTGCVPDVFFIDNCTCPAMNFANGSIS